MTPLLVTASRPGEWGLVDEDDAGPNGWRSATQITGDTLICVREITMNVGLIGRARSGKDTAGQCLVERRGYERVAFADVLKEAALKLDPIVDTTEYGDYTVDLSTVVADLGWEEAKDAHPEVRRILQELGAAIRAVDPGFWLRAAMAKVDAATYVDRPVVITDVRYPNEVTALRRAGFRLVYISRPGTPQLDHESERLTARDADETVHNAGTVDDLRTSILRIVDRHT